MSKVTSNKAVVVLAVGNAGRDLFAISGPSLKAYAAKIGADFHVIELAKQAYHIENKAAAKIGADFHVIEGEPIQPAYPMEDKFRVVQYLDYYERIIYFDADVTVEADAPNLFDIVPETHVGICDETLYETRQMFEPHQLGDIQRDYGFSVHQPDSYYNAGLMVISKRHKAVFKPPTVPYKVCHTSEQDLINARLLEYGTPIHPFGPELVWLWFTDQQQQRKDGRPFKHYAGASTLGPGHLAIMRGATGVNRWYLLNLERRPDRLKEATEGLTRAGIEFGRFEAVDGNKLPLPSNEKNGAGAFGCRLSHVRIMEDAIKNDFEMVGVFEDDVVFANPETFKEELNEVFSKLPSDWELLYLGGQHRQKPTPVKEGIVRCNDCHRTHSYIVRGEAIRKLYGIWSSNTGHVDHILRDTGSFQTLKAYAVEPWLTGQRASKSDINGRDVSERWWDTTPRPVKAQAVEEKDCKCKKTSETRRRLRALKGAK